MSSDKYNVFILTKFYDWVQALARKKSFKYLDFSYYLLVSFFTDLINNLIALNLNTFKLYFHLVNLGLIFIFLIYVHFNLGYFQIFFK